jgi:hypothetical protein
MSVRAGQAVADERPEAERRRAASIVTIGFAAEAFVPGQGDVFSLPAQPTRDDVALLVDAVERGLEESGNVIAIYPAWDPEPALRRLETVGVALDSQKIATYPTEMAPLAGAVLASLASACALHVSSAGLLFAGLPVLEQELIVYAWLNSVARLRTPPVRLRQHVLSWWPQTAFGVCVQPTPAIKRLTKKDHKVDVPTTYRPMCLAISPQVGSDEQWVMDTIAGGMGGPPVKSVPASDHAPKWWGTSRVAEAVAYPIDIPVVARRITQGMNGVLCMWCGEPVATPSCPFCGLDMSKALSPGGAS